MVIQGGEYRKLGSDQISSRFNSDEFSPIDGELIRFCDHVCAYIEAFLAIENGIRSKDFKKAVRTIEEKYVGEKIAGLKTEKFFAQFA
jgi:putative hydrolase of HD superfamily